MMNLELLLWAGTNSNNKTLVDMAVSHARTTAQNHVRKDGSTFHLVNYSPTGAVLNRCTAQGYTDNSTWSRGQAWCVYGFTLVYRYSKDPTFLQTAQKCADFFIHHTSVSSHPSDFVPMWDFDYPETAGNSYSQRDASAGAIAASGLLELSQYTTERAKKELYKASATRVLMSLKEGYLGDFNKTEGILLHATASYMTSTSVDVSLIYGGYYLIEALRRFNSTQ
jgi:unsaturated chondroitin disaccharide hydrolase